MAERTSYEPGTFNWIELRTTDGEGAKKFYSELFSWSTIDNQAGPDMIYVTLLKNEKDVAGLYEMPDEMRSQGVPAHWGHYISVESADETADKARELGGAVVMEPFDVMEIGRSAMIQDPTGANVSLWVPKAFFGAELVNEPGALCWNELATRDVESAKAFYTSLFGWGAETQEVIGGQYTTFMNGERHAGGMLQMTEDWGDIPPHWMAYFAFEDCEAAVEKINDLGGVIHHGPADIPNVGRFAVATDPQGAAFTVIKLLAPEE